MELGTRPIVTSSLVMQVSDLLTMDCSHDRDYFYLRLTNGKLSYDIYIVGFIRNAAKGIVRAQRKFPFIML